MTLSKDGLPIGLQRSNKCFGERDRSRYGRNLCGALIVEILFANSMNSGLYDNKNNGEFIYYTIFYM